jgi:hypothetical protein
MISLCTPSLPSLPLRSLDVYISGPLKRAYREQFEGIMIGGNDNIYDFLHLYTSARGRFFIRHKFPGFAGAGLWPVNQHQILEYITFQLPDPSTILPGVAPSATRTAQRAPQLNIPTFQHLGFKQLEKHEK